MSLLPPSDFVRQANIEFFFNWNWWNTNAKYGFLQQNRDQTDGLPRAQCETQELGEVIDGSWMASIETNFVGTILHILALIDHLWGSICRTIFLFYVRHGKLLKSLALTNQHNCIRICSHIFMILICPFHEYVNLGIVINVAWLALFPIRKAHKNNTGIF